MDTDSPLPIWIAHELSYLDDQGLIEWAVREVPKFDWHADNEILLELISLNPGRRESREQAGPILKRFIDSMWPEFDIRSPKATRYAQMWFGKRLREYIDGECDPWYLCRMVSPIEQIYDYPDWLGGLYDACDWLDPDSQSRDCPHLADEARVVLFGLTSRSSGRLGGRH